jgi:uncharacterized protein YggL (DUF469 family)
MKKRLRKKKRVGEFQEFGFKLGFEMDATLSNEERNALLDAFIKEAIESNGLEFGGGGSGSVWDGFAAANRHRGSAAERHREAVRNWLEGNRKITGFWIGELRDAWHGWPEEL